METHQRTQLRPRYAFGPDPAGSRALMHSLGRTEEQQMTLHEQAATADEVASLP